MLITEMGNSNGLNRTLDAPIMRTPGRKCARAFVNVNSFGIRARTRGTLGCVGSGFYQAVLNVLGVARSGGHSA